MDDTAVLVAVVGGLSAVAGAILTALVSILKARMDRKTAMARLQVDADSQLRLGELQAMAQFRADLMQRLESCAAIEERADTAEKRVVELEAMMRALGLNPNDPSTTGSV